MARTPGKTMRTPSAAPCAPWTNNSAPGSGVQVRCGLSVAMSSGLGSRPCATICRSGGHVDGVENKKRNTVERTINRLKGFRAVATRYDKRAYIYLGTVTLTALAIWLRT